MRLRRGSHHHARRAELAIDGALVLRGAEPGVNETDGLAVARSNDQSLAVKIRFAQYGLLECRWRKMPNQASLRRLLVPKPGNVWRIGVAKRSERKHGWSGIWGIEARVLRKSRYDLQPQASILKPYHYRTIFLYANGKARLPQTFDDRMSSTSDIELPSVPGTGNNMP